LSPTSTGRKLFVSPEEPTVRIKYPMIALITPASTSYHGFFRRIYPIITIRPIMNAGCCRTLVAKEDQRLIKISSSLPSSFISIFLQVPEDLPDLLLFSAPPQVLHWKASRQVLTYCPDAGPDCRKQV